MFGMHFRLANVVGVPTGTGLAVSISTATAAQVKALLNDTAEYRGLLVNRVWPQPPSMPEYSIFGQAIGADVSPPLPKQVSGLVATRTNFGGRRFRGRFYVPFPSEGANDPVVARPSAAYVTALQTLANTLLAGFNDITGPDTYDCNPVLFDRVTGGFTPITSVLARPYWATQRRRGDYGSQNVSPL